MMPNLITEQTPVPPPAYHRLQAKQKPSLHIDALTLVTTLQLSVVSARRTYCPSPLSPSAPCWTRWRTTYLQ